MTVKFLDPTGKELTAGQALDLWLSNRIVNVEYGSSNGMGIHLFADAVQGFSGAKNLLRQAGIEIKFGE